MLEKTRYADPADDVKEQGFRLVRAEYECIAAMADVPLAHLNRSRPASAAYQSMDDVIREWAACAAAMAMFAVNLRLITSEQAVEVVRDFRVHHPNLLP